MTDVIKKWIVGGKLLPGTCPECDGEGGHEWVEDYRDPGARDAHGQREGFDRCETCDGSGEAEEMPHAAYVELARRTMDPTLTRKERIAMCLLGMIGESQEAEALASDTPDAEVIKEAGDMLWYATMFAEDVEGYDASMSAELVQYGSQPQNPCEFVKKYVFHGVGEHEASELFHDVIYGVQEYAHGWAGVSVGHVRWKNIEKLLGRYPEGFVEGGGER